MKTATVTCKNGHTWKTSINGTVASITAYFMGKMFNTGSYPAEQMSQCVSVEVTE